MLWGGVFWVVVGLVWGGCGLLLVWVWCGWLLWGGWLVGGVGLLVWLLGVSRRTGCGSGAGGVFWWWVPPILVIAILFIGLFTIAVGMDEVANPRVRDRV